MNANSKRNMEDYFDDDFEVTYDGRLPEKPYAQNTQPYVRDSRGIDETRVLRNDAYDDALNDYDEYDDYDHNDSYYGEENRSHRSGPYETRTAVKRKRSRGAGKASRGLIRILMRTACLIINAAIIWMLIRMYGNSLNSFGDPAAIIETENYTLAGYLAIAAFFIVFEIIAFFRILSNGKVRTGSNTYRIDRGRGVFSFIFIFICSYLSWQLGTQIPQTPALLNGARSALILLGTMHNMLFWLGIAGITGCIIRRSMAK